jgi:hypothetical protein
MDAEIVDGPVSDAPNSDVWIVFDLELSWHLNSLDGAKRERMIVLPVAALDIASVASELVPRMRSLVGEPVVSPGAFGPFPIGETLGRGAFRIEMHLQGDGWQKLYLGRDTVSNESVLVSFDNLSSRTDVSALRSAVSYESPGVFQLAYVGRFDFRADGDVEDQASNWALVERTGRGAWLPSLMPTFEPAMIIEQESRRVSTFDEKTALPNAISLGRSAARLLADVAARGVFLTRVRPEYMWAAERDRVLSVTSLSARGDAFFATTRVDQVREPVFDRYYYAPEEDAPDRDDRALVFSLSIMVAEWATGRFPYKYKFHDMGPLAGKPLKLRLPKTLARLLVAGMSLERKQRPHLDEFVRDLEAIA